MTSQGPAGLHRTDSGYCRAAFQVGTTALAPAQEGRGRSRTQVSVEAGGLPSALGGPQRVGNPAFGEGSGLERGLGWHRSVTFTGACFLSSEAT